MVRQARELNQRYQQIAKELQNIKPIFTALIGAVMNDKGEYRITKTAQKKADDIGDISWRIQKAGGLVISTKPKEVTNG
ncbi:MAG: hypothetical protein GY771_05365 [bacterium]|nr:hypothetical protein [bacterium]